MICNNLSVNSLGHLCLAGVDTVDLAKKYGLIVHGDIRLNAANRGAVAELERLGFEDVILSPELTPARIRDIGGRSFATVYGRVPLMVTEKCVGRELGDCNSCKAGRTRLTDRKNVSFPVLREWEHRSLIVNSVPIFMADKQSDLSRAGITMRHFIFTTETRSEVNEVINCYKKGLPYKKQFTRI